MFFGDSARSPHRTAKPSRGCLPLAHPRALPAVVLSDRRSPSAMCEVSFECLGCASLAGSRWRSPQKDRPVPLRKPKQPTSQKQKKSRARQEGALVLSERFLCSPASAKARPKSIHNGTLCVRAIEVKEQAPYAIKILVWIARLPDILNMHSSLEKHVNAGWGICRIYWPSRKSFSHSSRQPSEEHSE